MTNRNPFTTPPVTLAWATSVAGLAAAACFAWLASPIPPRNALSFFLFYLSSSSIAGLLVFSVLYVAVTLWIGLAIIVIGEVFDRLRHQRGPEAWQVIFRGVAATLGLPPLIIAIAVGATPIAAAITVLLGICLARLLMLRGRAAARSQATLNVDLLFGNSALLVADVPFWRFGLPFLCSLSGQIGILAIFTRHRFAGAALLGASAALATWISPFGKLKRYSSRTEIVRQILRVALAGALVVLFTVAGIARYMGMVRGSGIPLVFLQILFGGPPASTASKQEALLKLPGQKGDYPGVILLPDPQEPALFVPPMTDTFANDSFTPDDIEFTGVYWVLKPPDREPPSHSPIIRASPAKVVLRSVDRMPLWMEARQPLRRPIDMNCCGAMQVVIGNADRDAAMVSIEVVLWGRQGPINSFQSLGYKFLPADAVGPGGDAPIEETLNFDMPRRSAMQQFDEIIVRFHLYGRRATVSAKMAVERFRFTSRWR